MLPIEPPHASGRRRRFRRRCLRRRRAAARAQALAPPAIGSGRAGGGGQTAVIDVNRARTDPIPIAIPAWAAATARPPSSARTSPASSPTTWRAFGPVPADRAGRVHPGRRATTATRRISRTGRPIGAQALVTGRVRDRRAAARSASSSGCGTCCRRPQIQGTAYTTTPGQLAAHRPHHGRRDLRAAAGREGLFRHPHRLHRRHRTARPAHQAPRDHGPGQREQPSPDRRFLAGADAALPSDARRDRVHELRQQPAAGLSVRPRLRPAERARRFRRHDVRAALLARWQQRGHGGDERRRVGHRRGRSGQPRVAPADQFRRDRRQPVLQPGRQRRSCSTPTAAATSNST